MNAVEQRQCYYRIPDVRARMREFLGATSNGQLSCEFLAASDENASPPFTPYSPWTLNSLLNSGFESAVRFGIASIDPLDARQRGRSRTSQGSPISNRSHHQQKRCGARRRSHPVARRRSQHSRRVTCHYFESSSPRFPTRYRFKTFAMKTSSISRARARQRVIRSIMVPVDFSGCSLTGLKYALKFAKEVGARLIVLHVTNLGPVMMTTPAAITICLLIWRQRGGDVAIGCELF